MLIPRTHYSASELLDSGGAQLLRRADGDEQVSQVSIPERVHMAWTVAEIVKNDFDDFVRQAYI